MPDRDKALDHMPLSRRDLREIVQISREVEASRMIRLLGVKDPAERARIRGAVMRKPPEGFRILSRQRILRGVRRR